MVKSSMLHGISPHWSGMMFKGKVILSNNWEENT